EAAGVWAHPDLGTVERQTDGSWQWTSADRTRASYHRTMSKAMKYARVAEPLDGEAAAQGIAGHIRPPWTPDEVATLNAWQHNGEVHPYTCGNDHDGDRVLVATRDGWVCPTCDYTQAWAHHVSTPDLVQLTNPRSGNMVTVDRTTGRIVDHGDTEAVA
ncbi:MAG TPA: hypothetical protein VKD22_10465, partial [Ramlibacter sp.]|nr:hypothetical protein [Ramlibacter sp.]